MNEKQMKSIIENCSDRNFQQLEEMVKKERQKRNNMLQAEVHIMLIKIRGLVHDIEDHGFVFKCFDREADANDLSLEWNEGK